MTEQLKRIEQAILDALDNHPTDRDFLNQWIGFKSFMLELESQKCESANDCRSAR